VVNRLGIRRAIVQRIHDHFTTGSGKISLRIIAAELSSDESTLVALSICVAAAKDI
jgi:hypothetical protein